MLHSIPGTSACSWRSASCSCCCLLVASAPRRTMISAHATIAACSVTTRRSVGSDCFQWQAAVWPRQSTSTKYSSERFPSLRAAAAYLLLQTQLWNTGRRTWLNTRTVASEVRLLQQTQL